MVFLCNFIPFLQEALFRSDPRYAHLNLDEPLHVTIECHDYLNRANARLENAVRFIEMLLKLPVRFFGFLFLENAFFRRTVWTISSASS